MKTVNNNECDRNRYGHYADPNVEVALVQQGAEMIVKVDCHFVHLLCVGIHRKHTPATVSDLFVNNETS